MAFTDNLIATPIGQGTTLRGFVVGLRRWCFVEAVVGGQRGDSPFQVLDERIPLVGGEGGGQALLDGECGRVRSACQVGSLGCQLGDTASGRSSDRCTAARTSTSPRKRPRHTVTYHHDHSASECQSRD
ncbi:hypothetical protein OOJ91_24575 [Micromonospora lupini]|uniref:hypothetical protein n=1 Tax=Micromonospora lupini TaxID=285679 RepID=UPI00224E94F3|nr:hypothetical protein [Micromonospora lupini]MCX5069024.1 hypothetical protein [Micromonospora lupini]